MKKMVARQFVLFGFDADGIGVLFIAVVKVVHANHVGYDEGPQLPFDPLEDLEDEGYRLFCRALHLNR